MGTGTFFVRQFARASEHIVQSLAIVVVLRTFFISHLFFQCRFLCCQQMLLAVDSQLFGFGIEAHGAVQLCGFEINTCRKRFERRCEGGRSIDQSVQPSNLSFINTIVSGEARLPLIPSLSHQLFIQPVFVVGVAGHRAKHVSHGTLRALQIAIRGPRIGSAEGVNLPKSLVQQLPAQTESQHDQQDYSGE